MSEVAEIPSGSLLTKKTSPGVIKRTFTKLSKLLDLLIAEMGRPLPPKAKFEMLDKEGFTALSNRLINTITKYVIFVCHEGTMKTIESQTSVLLEDVRKMCTSLRGLLPTATVTLKESIISVGSTILKELKELLNDICEQVIIQYNNQHQPESETTEDPNSLNKNDQITRVTARIWRTCEKLAQVPLNNTEAIAYIIQSQQRFVDDAHRELSEIVEVESNEEDTENVEIARPEGISDEEYELLKLEQELTGMSITSPAAAAKNTKQSMVDLDDDDDFTDKGLTREEMKYIPSTLQFLKIVGAVLRRVGDIIVHLGSPVVLNQTTGEISLGGFSSKKDAEAALEKFNYSLEARRIDAEYIATHVDTMVSNLYAPQDIPAACRSAFFIASRLSKMVLWLDIMHKQGLLKQFHEAVANTEFVDVSQVLQDAVAEFESIASTRVNEMGILGKTNWTECWLTNCTIEKPKGTMILIEGEDTLVEGGGLPLSDSILKRKNEFQEHKVSSTSNWNLINEMRKNLHACFISNNSLVNLHTIYCSVEDLVDDSEDDEEAQNAYYYDEDEDEDDYDDDDFLMY